jgi:acetyl esterase/lipase
MSSDGSSGNNTQKNTATSAIAVDRRKLLALLATAGSLAATQAAAAALADSGPAANIAPILSGGELHLEPRVIPEPLSVTQQARAYLAACSQVPFQPPPPVSDKEAWRAFIVKGNSVFDPYLDTVMNMPGASIETLELNGVSVYVAKSEGVQDSGKVNFFIHGGSFVNFGGRYTGFSTKIAALQYGGTVYGVDYRMPPDHPFPTPLDDCVAAYRAVLDKHPPSSLLVSGDSAGGNLAAAIMLKANKLGLPKPSALLLNTPVSDLTGISDSLQINHNIDVVLKEWTSAQTAIYIGNADAHDPFLSPLYGDLAKAFPPTYLRTGTRDLLLSDTVRLHAALRKAGVEADLFVAEAMPHAGFGGFTAEDNDNVADTKRWLANHWGTVPAG